MLDSTLIKFVEPIGPGQIVDRDSLVALPIGYIQVSIEHYPSELVVKILGVRGTYSNVPDADLPSNTHIKTYIWQGGEIVAGEEIMEGTLESASRPVGPRFASIRRRRAGCGNNFRFRKDPTNKENKDAIVDGILQICAYRPSGPKNLQRKSFLGTVHISLKSLTSNQLRSSKETLLGNEEWYKVFPKSAFLPGSPTDIARSNCYISGQSIEEEEETDEILLDGAEVESTASSSTTTSIASSASVVSFNQFGLKKSRTPSIFCQPGTVLRSHSTKKTRDASDSIARSKRALMKLFKRHKSVGEFKLDSTPNRRLPAPISASAPAVSSPFLVASPSSTTSRSYFKNSFRSSCSTFSSSSDIGYESSRSECSAASGEDDFRKCKKSVSRTSGRVQKEGDSSPVATADKPCQRFPSNPSLPNSSSAARPVTVDSTRGKISKRNSQFKVSSTFSSVGEIYQSNEKDKQ